MNKPADRPRRTNWQNVSTVLCAAVLIGAEVFGMAYAFGWAIAILMDLGAIGAYALQALFFIAGLAVMAKFVRGAARIEPFTH